MVTLFASGELRVGALINGKPGWATVRIKPQQVASVTIKAPAAALVPGAAARVDAQTFTRDGVPRDGVEVRWKSESPSVATVDAAGVVTAVAPGRATIRATSGTGETTAVVTVAANPVSALTVEPRIKHVRTGDVVRFSALARQDGLAGSAVVRRRQRRDDRCPTAASLPSVPAHSWSRPPTGPRVATASVVVESRKVQRNLELVGRTPMEEFQMLEQWVVRRLPLRDLRARRQALGLRHPRPLGAGQSRLAQLRRPHPERRQRLGRREDRRGDTRGRLEPQERHRLSRHLRSRASEGAVGVHGHRLRRRALRLHRRPATSTSPTTPRARCG